MKNSMKKVFVLLLALVCVLSVIPVFAAEKTQYTKISDFDGKNVGVQTACLYETHIVDRAPNAKILYYTMPQDMILALESGKIDGYLIEEVGYYAQAAAHPELEIVPESVGLCEAAVVVGENDRKDTILSQLNQFIADHNADGMLDEMYDYWIRNFDADTSDIKDCTFTGENGDLVIAVEGGYEPFSYVKENKDCGFDIDFIYRFCEEYGYNPVVERVAFDSIAPGVESGKYDVGMNIILSDEREDNATLSDVYYTCDIFMVVYNNETSADASATASDVVSDRTISDFDGKNVGVQTACLYETHIVDRAPNAKISYYTMPQDMILALNSGKIDGYLIEEVGYYAQAATHPELKRLAESAGLCEAAVVVGENDRKDTILSQLNQFIADHTEDGVLDEMYDYWIRNFDADTSDIKECTFTGESGDLVIAVEGGYEPFSYVKENQDCGFDIDFIYRFCEEYGYNPVVERVAFDSIAPGVESGKYDVGMNIILSDEREDNATLSDVYYTCDIFMVVLGEEEQETGFLAKMKDNFNNTFIKDSRWQMFLSGAGITLLITLSSIILGTLLGFAVYMLCRKGNVIANKITAVVTWIIQGMPTVVLLMILYYIILTKINGTMVAIIGFTLIFACSMYDMLVVGFNAIGRGQFEAATALGYSDSQSFFKVLLPQAARHFLPIYKNEVITLLKETSVAGYIAIQDLTKVSDLVRARTYQAFFALIFTAIMYFVLEALFTFLIGRVEKMIDPKRRVRSKILEGIKEIE